MIKPTIIISCEHGVNTIPKPYVDLFVDHQDLLNTHRGIDFGSLEIAENLAKTLDCRIFQATTSRLLIDYNRSLKHPACFSEISQVLSMVEKGWIIDNYYLPYREQVEEIIEHEIHHGIPIWHFSIHSFTPILHNITRNADIGILYDPRRKHESTLSKYLRQIIKHQNPRYKVRMNYPYQGVEDGFTTLLRKRYPDPLYTGLEIECNQGLVFNKPQLVKLIQVLNESFLRLTDLTSLP